MFVYRRHSEYVYEEARKLCASGLSDYEVGRRLDVPRATVQNWRRRARPRQRGAVEPPPDRYEPPDRRIYAYLVGLYLGDGCIWGTGPRSWRLAIYCDGRYPELLDEVEAAIATCASGAPVRRNRRPRAATVVVLASSSHWPAAFPQHGPGRKHYRRIELANWQREITAEHPQALLRGLIHSDGCRTENRFKTKLPSGRVAEYSYPRYFFSNLSADIRGIFCEHCDLLGIRWTQSNHRNISISDRDSVALLDSFVGPKS